MTISPSNVQGLAETPTGVLVTGTLEVAGGILPAAMILGNLHDGLIPYYDSTSGRFILRPPSGLTFEIDNGLTFKIGD